MGETAAVIAGGRTRAGATPRKGIGGDSGQRRCNGDAENEEF